MNLQDMTIMGFSNLWRTRLRSTLTVLGVVIGIGALTSMVSFGTGMQKNLTDAFTKNDLFTSMNVTPKDLNVDELMSGDISGIGEMMDEKPKPLTDSLLEAIREMEGVQLAFPDESFAGKLKFNDKEVSKNMQPIPAAASEIFPYNDLLAGELYPHDSSQSVVVKWETLRDLGLIVEYPDSSEGKWLTLSPSPTCSSSSFARGFLFRLGIPAKVRGKTIFSMAVRFGRRLKDWKIIPTLNLRCIASW